MFDNSNVYWYVLAIWNIGVGATDGEMPRLWLSSLESVFFQFQFSQLWLRWFHSSFANILTVPEAEIQYDNYNIIFDGEHNNLLALDMMLEEQQGEWVPLLEAVIFL